MALTTTLAVTALAAGLSLTGSVPAGASVSTPASAPAGSKAPKLTEEQWQQRLELACGRVELAIARVEQRQRRIGADAGVRGSIERLERRAQRLEQAGQDELAELVRIRITLRRQVAELLPERLEALRKAEQVCADAGQS